MPTRETALLSKEELTTFHSIYAAVHRAHKEAPALWTAAYCKNILSALMGHRAYSWRVIGVTPACLKKFAELDFQYQKGITRGHIFRRIDTVRKILAPKNPLSARTFFDTWLKRDITVLCAEGENTTSVPPFIQIENEDAALFSGKSVGWRHGPEERTFLKQLSDSPSRHRLVQAPKIEDVSPRALLQRVAVDRRSSDGSSSGRRAMGKSKSKKMGGERHIRWVDICVGLRAMGYMDSFSKGECLRIANMLAKRVEAGEVHKVERGLYAVPTEDPPSDPD